MALSQTNYLNTKHIQAENYNVYKVTNIYGDNTSSTVGSFIMAILLRTYSAYVEQPAAQSGSAPLATTCVEGTRVNVLRNILAWVNDTGTEGESSTVTEENVILPRYTRDNPTILCLLGAAGAGKTTIARTIQGRRGIYVGPHQRDGNSARNIVPSIAQDLKMCNSEEDNEFLTEDEVTRVVGRDPGNLERLVDILLLKPLKKMNQKNQKLTSFVVIIDALDEMAEVEELGALLDLLRRRAAEFYPLRIIITSQPRQDLQRLLSNDKNEKQPFITLNLDSDADVSPSDLQAEMSTYLRAKCDQAPRFSLSQDQVDTIVEASGRLFQYIHVCAKYITDPKVAVEDRKWRAEELTGMIQDGKLGSHATGDLTALYNKVLGRFPKSEPSAELKQVITALVLAPTPLSTDAWDRLLGLGVKGTTTATEIVKLYAVVQHSKDGSVSLHSSFKQFLQIECNQEDWKVIPRAGHTDLALRCLTLLQPSRLRNFATKIRPFQDPTIPLTAQDKQTYAEAPPMDPYRRYAYEWWGYHFALSEPTEESPQLELLLKICEAQEFLYWIEICASMGRLRSALQQLSKTYDAVRAIQVKDGSPDRMKKTVRRLASLLESTKEWIRDHYDIIIATPIQVHHLAYHPRIFPPEYASIGIQEIAYQGRSSPEPIEFHSNGTICSLAAFTSVDGQMWILAASGNSLEIWDLLSKEQQLLGVEGEQHSGRIWCVAVSKDGRYAATGSDDTTVKIWDLDKERRRCIWTLSNHNQPVTSVSFSPTSEVYQIPEEFEFSSEVLDLKPHPTDVGPWRSRRFVSGDAAGTVIHWEIGAKNKLSKYQIDSSPIRALSYYDSDDFCRILSGSEDGGLLFYDVASGEPPRELFRTPAGESAAVNAVHISHLNPEEMIWSTTGGLIRRMLGPDSEINVIAGINLPLLTDRNPAIGAICFTESEGGMIYSTDGYIHFHQISNGLRISNGVSGNLFRSLGVIGDYLIAASGSRSSVIYAYNLRGSSKESAGASESTSGEPLATSSEITCVTISSDSKSVFVGRASGRAHLWRQSNGSWRGQECKMASDESPSERGMEVLSAAFSADSSTLVFGIGKRDVRGDGAALYKLEGSGGITFKRLKAYCMTPVNWVVFSPVADNQVAYAMVGNGVGIWDTSLSDANRTHAFKTPVKVTKAVSFSPDGAKIAIIGEENFAKLFKVADGKGKVGTTKGQVIDLGRADPVAVAFTANGEAIIVITQDGGVGIFNAEDGGTIRMMINPNLNSVSSPVVSPGFTHLVESVQKLEGLEVAWIGAKASSFAHERLVQYTRRKLLGHLSGMVAGRRTELVVKDNWLWCLTRQRRIMPLPNSLPITVAQEGNIVVIGFPNFTVQILDITGLLDKLDKLDEQSPKKSG